MVSIGTRYVLGCVLYETLNLLRTSPHAVQLDEQNDLSGLATSGLFKDAWSQSKSRALQTRARGDNAIRSPL
jgi:hypothetical protein